MASCAQTCCNLIILILIIYFFGINRILDGITYIIDYIPLLNTPLSWLLTIAKFIINHFPFYYIYVIIICILNIVLQLFLSESMSRGMIYRGDGVSEIFGKVVICFVLPMIGNLILIDWDLVGFLIMPFLMASTAQIVKA